LRHKGETARKAGGKGCRVRATINKKRTPDHPMNETGETQRNDKEIKARASGWVVTSRGAPGT